MAIAESDDAKGLDVQAVSVILNGFARAGIRDVALFQSMSAVAIRLMDSEPDDFGAQAISVIANAFAKVRVTDEELFTRLARCAERVPARSYTPQAIANIMNAYAHRLTHPDDSRAALSGVPLLPTDHPLLVFLPRALPPTPPRPAFFVAL